MSKKHPPFKKGGLLKNYRLIFNSKQNPKKLILRYNVSLYYTMIFSHRSLLDKLYPLISSVIKTRG
ncbi:hypothetical protein EC541_04875 [Helicobacter pylori]|nr:hypothetical protein EC541_04875 [Helicobacter pylori]